MINFKLGFNPLPWTLQHTENKFDFERQYQGLRRSLTEMTGKGVEGVSLLLPGGVTTEGFQQLVDEFSFTVAPGFLALELETKEQHAAALESAKIFAQTNAELGVTEAFVACKSTPTRYARPTQGFDASDDRLRTICDGLVEVADVLAEAGIVSALHPHVACWVETEEEIRKVLDWSRGTDLQFGPDTGHLTWAGADLCTLLRDYRDRIAAIHIKDVHQDRIKAAELASADYLTTTETFNIWTEPGKGAIDFKEVFAILGPEWTGWTIFEVDKPDEATPLRSTIVSLDYIRTLFPIK